MGSLAEMYSNATFRYNNVSNCYVGGISFGENVSFLYNNFSANTVGIATINFVAGNVYPQGLKVRGGTLDLNTYGFYLASNKSNFNTDIIQDLNITNTVTSDLLVNGVGNYTFVNVTYSTSSFNDKAKIRVQWPLDLTMLGVNSGLLQGAGVGLTMNNNSLVQSKVSDQSGKAIFNVTEYDINSTQKYFYTNYTISATAPNYLPYSLQRNITSSTQLSLQMSYIYSGSGSGSRVGSSSSSSSTTTTPGSEPAEQLVYGTVYENTPIETPGVKKGGSVSFTVNKESHKIEVLSINGNQVTLQISSDPIEVTLIKGASTTLDLNEDGFKETKITLENIIAYKAYLKIELLAHPVQEEPEEIIEVIETPTEEPEPAPEMPKDQLIAGGIALLVLIIIAITTYFIHHKKPKKKH